MQDDKELDDPTNGYTYTGRGEHEGVEGTVKIRKWLDKETGTWKEKLLSFVSRDEQQRREKITPPKEVSEIEQKREAKVEKTFLEQGFSANPLTQERKPEKWKPEK